MTEDHQQPLRSASITSGSASILSSAVTSDQEIVMPPFHTLLAFCLCNPKPILKPRLPATSLHGQAVI